MMLDTKPLLEADAPWQPAQWRGSIDRAGPFCEWRPIYSNPDGSPRVLFYPDIHDMNWIQVRILVDGEWRVSDVLEWIP